MALYQEAGWWQAADQAHPEGFTKIVQNSAVFAGAFAGEHLIGMGRALSDLVSDAYIQDVTVLKAYRGNGIGKKIIQTLVNALKDHGVDWIGLVAQPGTQSFYHALGFEPLKGHTALKYTDI